MTAAIAVAFLAITWLWLTRKWSRLINQQARRIDELEQDMELATIAHENHTGRHAELCERIVRNERLARERNRRIRQRVRRWCLPVASVRVSADSKVELCDAQDLLRVSAHHGDGS